MVSLSLIWGVTFITNPTGTVDRVVLVAVVETALIFPGPQSPDVKVNDVVDDRSRAVWLLSTEIFGLESTRTFPKDSSNWRTPEILVPLLALTVKMLGNPGVLGSPAAVPVWLNSTEVKPRTRKTDQSIPC